MLLLKILRFSYIITRRNQKIDMTKNQKRLRSMLVTGWAVQHSSIDQLLQRYFAITITMEKGDIDLSRIIVDKCKALRNACPKIYNSL